MKEFMVSLVMLESQERRVKVMQGFYLKQNKWKKVEHPDGVGVVYHRGGGKTPFFYYTREEALEITKEEDRMIERQEKENKAKGSPRSLRAALPSQP